jgi:hypothetical protein
VEGVEITEELSRYGTGRLSTGATTAIPKSCMHGSVEFFEVLG